MSEHPCIYVKDEDGLFTADPKKDPAAKHIPEIALGDLLETDLNDLILERSTLNARRNSVYVEKLYIVNGLKSGSITRALHGHNAGTIIYKA